MFEIESGIPFLEEESKQHYVEPAKTIVQDDEFYGATSEQKRAYLAQRQSLPLSVKIRLTERRISEWYEAHNGKVYVAFSGGKDSTVLLDIVRSLYPEVPAVFSDTGLEYPEIRDFVKTIDNVVWLKPKKNFKQVIEKYGYPVISKEQSQFIYEYCTTKSDKLKTYRLDGNSSGGGKISKKWLSLTKAPFRCSHLCCHYLKKQPFYIYEKETKNKGFVGVMADESKLREQSYLKFGCNSFNSNRQTSRPMMFWRESDVFQYLTAEQVPYCSEIYGAIVKTQDSFASTKETRTGCLFCMFGVHLEKTPNKFQRMKITHPQLHDYCINKLNLKQVLDYINIPYE